MQKTLFTIDSIDQFFEGYAEQGYWNGWAKPWFTKEVGFEIMKAMSTDDYPIKYNAETDTFEYYGDPEYPPEEFKGKDIDGKHLYPIGNMSWVWDNVADYAGKQGKILIEYLQDTYHYLDSKQLYDVYYGITQEINGYMTDKEVKIFADGFMTAYDRRK